jgi:hypothetical protein
VNSLVSESGLGGAALIRHVCEFSHVATQLLASIGSANVKVLVRGYREMHVLPVEGVKVNVTGWSGVLRYLIELVD